MIACVGLGNIGLAIARRLVVRGHDVVGVEIVEARRAAWEAMTGRVAVSSLDDVNWASVERVFVIVRMTADAKEVMRILAGRVSDERPLACHVVTTLEADFARSLGSITTPSLRVIEQPVSGGEIGAMAGRLTVLLAGDVTEEDVSFLLGSLATNVVRFDAFGDPTLSKLFNNVTGAYNALALADMLLLGAQHGIDPGKLYQVLLTSSGGSWMATGFLELLDDMLAKDVRLLHERLGRLPTVELGDGGGLAVKLAEARALLAGP